MKREEKKVSTRWMATKMKREEGCILNGDQLLPVVEIGRRPHFQIQLGPVNTRFAPRRIVADDPLYEVARAQLDH